MLPAIALALLLAQQGKPDMTIPIHFAAVEAVPWLDVRIDGRLYRFGIDTGNPYPLIVSNELARRVGNDLDKAKTEDLNGLKSRVVSMPAIDLAGEPVAAHLEPYAQALAVDLSTIYLSGRPLDGLIGLPLLSQLQTEFDYEKRRIVFHQQPLGNEWAKAKALPYIEKDLAMFVEVKLPGGPVSMSFDTGRGLTNIDPKERAKLDERGSRLSNGDDLYDKGDQERLYTPNVGLVGFDLGPAALQLRARGSLLGNDVLRCFRFVLDPAHKRILMERNEGSRPALPGDEAMNLGYRDGKFVIDATTETPERGGLRAKDILRTVEGKTVTDLDTWEISNAVNGDAGTMAHLTVERDGKPIEVCYERPSAYGFVDDDKAGRSGIAETKLAPEGLIVTAMKAGRPLWNAGVRPGDRIVEIGGKTLAGLSQTDAYQASSILRTGGTTLKVKRGNEPPREVKLDPF